MRRAVFAASFDRDAEAIGIYIERQFGERVRREFVADLARTCANLAAFPGMGHGGHGYPTALRGFVFRLSWVFFEYDDNEVRFLHMRDSRMNKPDQLFSK